MAVDVRVWVLGVGLSIAQVTAGAAQDSRAYDAGLRDRTAYEQWFAGLDAESQRGAAYWAAGRGLRQPPSCMPAPDTNRIFEQGCRGALTRLAPADMRRRAEPDYRRGWNSYTTPTAASPAPTAHTEVAPPAAPAPEKDAKPVPKDDPDAYVVKANLSYGCEAPENAAALGQHVPHYSGSIITLDMEARANDCYRAAPGMRLWFVEEDSETHALLMELPTPTYILGHGKITRLWFDRYAFAPP